MWRLVVAHQKKRTPGVTVTHAVQGLVGDDARYITTFFNVGFHFYHLRIEVLTLTGKNRPKVEPGWLVVLAFPEMSLADHSCLIAT
mgnify:CR=1 FL=1